jgi:GAF domain-containing protein
MPLLAGIPAERLPDLLRAVTAIGSEDDLDRLLRHTATAARDLLRARFGGLVVIGDDGSLLRFVFDGPDDAEFEPGRFPAPVRLLSALPADGALRVDDVSSDERFECIPPGHPGMRSFLGLALRSDGMTVGNLYLGDRIDGQPFTAEDEALAVALGSVAAIAVRLARALRRGHQRERWVDALRECTAAVLAGGHAAELLDLVTRRAVWIVDCDAAVVSSVDEERGDVEVVAAYGGKARTLIGSRLPIAGTLAQPAIATRRPYVTPDASREPADQARVGQLGAGPVMVLPLVAGDELFGVLSLVRRRGDDPFGEEDIALMASFADQAALVLQMDGAREELDRMRITADRERIARDLHDTVMQRIFAAGMSLQAAAQLVDDAVVQGRLADVVEQLDATIREVRSTVFEVGSRPL